MVHLAPSSEKRNDSSALSIHDFNRVYQFERLTKPVIASGIRVGHHPLRFMHRLSLYMRSSLPVLAIILGLTIVASPANGQRIAKYGADFLAGGVGARALAMGGAYISVADDVYAGFWNPAGLHHVTSSEASYMHSERFSGIVSFDYAGYAVPFSEKSVIGVTLIRSGVNDIKNTLDAWDTERNQPIPDPESAITTFSAADYALIVGYGKRINDRLSIGVSSKIIRRSIGDFAKAWGYSMDVGLQYRSGDWAFGLNAQDITTMLQSWSINESSLTNLRDVFGDDLPEGGTELVLPVLRFGSARNFSLAVGELLLSVDMDVAFDGQNANSFGSGDVSLHPRIGLEYSYAQVLAFRTGLNRIQNVEGEGLDLTPSVGAGLKWGQAALDYGFGDFAGIVSDLGFSHRISVQYRFSSSE